MTTPQAFQIAIQRHQAGSLADAEGLYRQILAVQPNHAGALHYLGVIAHQMGRYEAAVELIRQALVFQPDHAEAQYNLGRGAATIQLQVETNRADHERFFHRRRTQRQIRTRIGGKIARRRCFAARRMAR
jgi:tetratricopeptide (TPR) repeat protein